MAAIPDSINKTINRYLDLLNKNGIKVVKAILFGSCARGYQSEWSDIDIAIVSDSFSGSRFENRKKIRALTLKVNSSLEVQPYSPDDFSEEDPFVKEIIDTGVQIV